MNRKKKSIIVLVLQCILFVSIIICTNDVVKEHLHFDLVPYLGLCMFLNAIIGFAINRDKE